MMRTINSPEDQVSPVTGSLQEAICRLHLQPQDQGF